MGYADITAEQIAAVDEMAALSHTIRQATAPRRFERTKGLTYIEVPAEYFGRVVIGCYYEPAQPARPTSAYVFSRTGDPGDRRHWNLFGSHGVHLRQSSWRKSRGYLVSRLQNLRARALEDRAIEQARRGGRRVPLELPCADLGAAPLRQMP